MSSFPARFAHSSANPRRSVLLIHPPYGDFTYPYHSLSYVTTPLKAAGYDVEVLDLNILWFRRLFSADTINQWHEELLREFCSLDRKPSLNIDDQQRILELLQALAVCNSLNPEEAIETFRSATFYDFGKYLQARGQVRAFERLLNHFYPGYDFFSSFAVPPYLESAETVVARAQSLDRMIHDFADLLREHCRTIDYLFCGVSFPFSAQLIPGMAVFLALKTLFPGSPLVAGGTAISDVFKYKRQIQSVQPFSEACDFFYIGEAESSLIQFSAWCEGKDSSCPSQIIDLRNLENAQLSKLPYISLSGGETKKFQAYDWSNNPPDYTWIDWSLYLAPERRVNYSPSRGCFWNRCTFCDYGLNNDGPTAPARTTETKTLIEHLRLLTQQGIHHVYMAVDAISPSQLEALADELIKEELNIHWSTQFFITRQFTKELINKLEASGMRLASFGLESGSSRVLDWMGKGRNRVQDVLLSAFEAFASSSIGLQPLFFFGFPGETDDDRQQTVDLLLKNRNIFSTISKGGMFDLLPGSIIANNPDRFGITQIRRRPADEIGGALEYQLTSGGAPSSCDAFKPFNDQLPHWSVLERPWAGGVDAFHTQLYVERFGKDTFHELQSKFGNEGEPWGTITISARFDLNEVIENAILFSGLESMRKEIKPSESLRIDNIEVPSDLFDPIPGEANPKNFNIQLRQFHEI